MARIAVFSFFLLLCLNTKAQYQLTLKNGSYGVKTDRGKTILKERFDTVVFCQDSLSHLAIATINGEKFLHDMSAKGKHLEAEVRFTEMEEIRNNDLSTSIKAFDQFGNQHDYINGTWMAPTYWNVKRQVGLGFNGLVAVTDSVTVYGDYDYIYLTEISNLLYMAGTDSGTVAVNLDGAVAYPFAVDRVYRVYNSDSTFICGRKDLWGFFTLDGEYNFPLSEMENGESIFNIDGDSYASIHQDYILKRNGKWGMVNDKNEVVWEFEYDEFVRISGEANYAIRKGGTWSFITFSHEKIAEITCDRFITMDGHYILYLRDNKLKFYNWKEKLEIEEIDLTDKESNHSIYYDYKGNVGAISDKGKVIIDFEYSVIRLKNKYSEFPILLVKKEGKAGVFDSEGNLILEPIYDEISMICDEETSFLEIKKKGFVAIAKLNSKTQSIDFLTDFIYKGFRCLPFDEQKPLGALYDENRTDVGYLNRDGSVTTIKERGGQQKNGIKRKKPLMTLYHEGL